MTQKTERSLKGSSGAPNWRNNAPLQLLLIVTAAILTFVGFHEQFLSGHDPGNFALALKYGYNVPDQRPHAPGYPGFILVWELIELVTGCTAHAAMLALNLIFSLLAIVLSYVAAKRIYGDRTAIFTALFVFVNPLFLYFENVAEIYAYDAAFSAFLVMLLLAPPKRWELALFFVYGLLGEFRLSSFILTVPVVAIVIAVRAYRGVLPMSRMFSIVAMIAAGFAAWFVPFVMYVGGWQKFLAIFAEATALGGTLAQNLSTFLVFMLWMLNAGLVLLVVNSGAIARRLRTPDERLLILLLLIAVPASFFAFKYYAKGYALIYLVPLSVLLARVVESVEHPKRWMTVLCVVPIALFLFTPFIPPSVEASLNYEHRTKTERFESAVLRGTSFYAPTVAHIRASDDAIDRASQLLDIPTGEATVVLNGGAALWAYPRSLQLRHPALDIVMTLPADSEGVQHFHESHVDYTHHWSDFMQTDSLYYLNAIEMERVAGKPPAKVVADNGRLRLYVVSRAQYGEFKSYVTNLFFRK